MGGKFMGGRTGMRGAGAAKRREQEPSPEPDLGAAVAEIRRIAAGADAIHGRLSRHDRAIAGIIRDLEKADPGSADTLAGRLAQVTVELISAAAHCAEARQQGEVLASLLGLRATLYEAGVAEGRRREAEERDRQAQRSPGPRHARARHLRIAGTAVKATAVAAAAATATTMIASHESAQVRPWAPHPAAVRLHAGPPDVAVPVPSPSFSSSPRPSAAAASAHPAPTMTVPPSVPVSPPPPPPSSPPPSVSPVPVLDVPRLLDLGASIRGVLTLTAGDQAVTWTARATDGITLSQYGGVAVQGQAVTLEVTDPTGNGGWVYVSFGGTTIPVQVTSSLGIPALP